MNVSPTALTCPKCGAEMRPYERNGVVIDQCTGCRGIFLDRGELESLMDAESSFYAARNPAAPVPAAPVPGAGGRPPRWPRRPRFRTWPQARRVPRGPLRLSTRLHAFLRPAIDILLPTLKNGTHGHRHTT